MAAYETIGTSGSADRIAPTRPSIMSLGQTASAPASTWLTAVRTSDSSVSSFATVSPSSVPQCPCSVYSQRQTSVRSVRPGASALSARRARWTIPSSSQAPEPSASFDSGIPKRSTARTPAAVSSWASRTISSTDRWAMPGSPATGRTTPSPGQAKSGITTSSSEREVSRTSARSVSVRRSRRRRVAGKLTPRSVEARAAALGTHVR